MAEQSAQQRAQRQRQYRPVRLANPAIGLHRIPDDVMTYLSGLLDSQDLLPVSLANRRWNNAVSRSMTTRKRLDLDDVPGPLLENPATFSQKHYLKELRISGTRAHHVDLSQSHIMTLRLNQCRFSSLLLPPALKELYIEDFWLDGDESANIAPILDLSTLNLTKIDIDKFHGDVSLPLQTQQLTFLRVSNFFDHVNIQNVVHYLSRFAFPRLRFLQVYHDLNENPFLEANLHDLNHMPQLETLCCASNMIDTQATVLSVRHLIMIFDQVDTATPLYAFFPNVTSMAAILNSKVDSFALPPLLDTLFLFGFLHVPVYWNPAAPLIQNLVIKFYWTNGNLDEDEFLENNPEAEVEDFYKGYEIPRVPNFQIDDCSTNETQFFEWNPQLEPYLIQHGENLNEQMANMMGLDTTEFNFDMFEECRFCDFDEVQRLRRKQNWERPPRRFTPIIPAASSFILPASRVISYASCVISSASSVIPSASSGIPPPTNFPLASIHSPIPVDTSIPLTVLQAIPSSMTEVYQWVAAVIPSTGSSSIIPPVQVPSCLINLLSMMPTTAKKLKLLSHLSDSIIQTHFQLKNQTPDPSEIMSIKKIIVRVFGKYLSHLL